MKFKVGDKVRVREDLETFRMYGRYEFDEEMEQYKGEQAIIVAIDEDGYILDIDVGAYFWADEMLEPVAENNAESDENKDESIDNTVETIDKSIDQFTKDDLKFGDIITFKKGDIAICIGKRLNNEYVNIDLNNYNCNFNYLGNANDFDIMKVQRIDPTFIGECLNLEDEKTKIRAIETLYERKEDILDEKEKEWLRNLLKSLHNTTISSITKIKEDDVEKIKINYMTKIQLETFFSSFTFPPFLENTMYKGMEINKKYTLKELGL